MTWQSYKKIINVSFGIIIGLLDIFPLCDFAVILQCINNHYKS